MIFKRTLRRELIATASAVFMALLTITTTIMLVRVLNRAAQGRVDSADVVALMGFSVLNYLAVMIALTGFISVLLVITRSYHDSEMVVWFASGMSLKKWIAPVVTFALPILLVSALSSFFVTPWAVQQQADFKARFENRDDVSRVSPGRFQESSSADRVFFAEGMKGALSEMRNVFINTKASDGSENIVVAKSGAIRVDEEGRQLLVLENGASYGNAQNNDDLTLMNFDRYTLVVSSDNQTILGEQSARGRSTWLLLSHPSQLHLGELLWRISMPVMTFLLMMFAIPLAFVNPRAGRSINLFVAILLFATYSNLISFFRAGVMRGNIEFGMAWWPLHLAIILLTLLMFALRLNVNSHYHPLAIWSRYKRKRPPVKGVV